MRKRGRQFSFPWHRRRVEWRTAAAQREGAYALLVIMIAVTLLLISLTAALPNAYVAGQREREEELIFRGNEYGRAIALFHRQFNRYPTSVKELLQTSGIRFLRRPYSDPMSRSGKWRFIHADAGGAILDSRTQPRPPSPTGAKTLSPAPDATEEGRETSVFFGEGKETQGAFIVGVASGSRRKSIRVWNGRTRYDEWEFIALTMTPAGAGPTPRPQAPSPGQPGQQPPVMPTLPPLTERLIPQQ